MDTIILIIAGPLFLAAVAGHIYVKFRLRPGDDLDEYYHEFEDQHPGYAKYSKWSRITLTTAIISMLLLFIAIAL